MDDEYTRIFIGREKDLDLLSRRFDDRIAGKDPAKVYSYLNAPGIGKTTLLNRFGKRIENEGRGLHIYYSCSSIHRTLSDLVQDLIDVLTDVTRNKIQLIQSFIESSEESTKLERYYQDFRGKMDETIRSKAYDLRSLRRLIQLLNYTIPTFFSIDEIQELQRIPYKGTSTLLSPFAKFLASLLSTPMLLVISGTQYSIMSQIGHGIGSPLNGKIETVVISPLKSDHIRQYITEFRKVYSDQPYTEELESYLLGFSGGHPRTIEMIVKSFFTLRDVTNFTENLTKKVNTLLSKSLLNQEKIEALRQMQDYEEYNEVKLWFLQGLDDNLRLNTELTEEDNALIFQLMTMGLIVMNGDSNYYITSYFHAVVILKTLTEPYEQFLYEVLNNRYFREMVGGYSGLGFTFERILFASLILHGNTENQSKQLIFNVKNLNRIEIVNSKDLKKALDVELRQDTLYSLPNAKDVDGIFKLDGEIILAQITTIQSGIQEKFHNFERAVQECNVKGWFISLYESDIEENSLSKITMGSEVAEILGEKLYQRMLEIKKYLKTEI